MPDGRRGWAIASLAMVAIVGGATVAAVEPWDDGEQLVTTGPFPTANRGGPLVVDERDGLVLDEIAMVTEPDGLPLSFGPVLVVGHLSAPDPLAEEHFVVTVAPEPASECVEWGATPADAPCVVRRIGSTTLMVAGRAGAARVAQVADHVRVGPDGAPAWPEPFDGLAEIGRLPGREELLARTVRFSGRLDGRPFDATVGPAGRAAQVAHRATMTRDPKAAFSTDSSIDVDQLEAPRERQVDGRRGTFGLVSAYQSVLVVDGDPGVFVSFGTSDDDAVELARRLRSATVEEIERLSATLRQRHVDDRRAELADALGPSVWEVPEERALSLLNVWTDRGGLCFTQLALRRPGSKWPPTCVVLEGKELAVDHVPNVPESGPDGGCCTEAYVWGAVSARVARVQVIPQGGQPLDARIHVLDPAAGGPHAAFLAHFPAAGPAAEEAVVVAYDAAGAEVARRRPADGDGITEGVPSP